MVIRLQGFDKGVFGGNFHTSNLLQHIPPGVDVLCYSNGEDYARGFRNAVRQAKAGRVVMLVDSTNLLNLRHLFDRDRAWERTYPPPEDEFSAMGFDEVRRYGTAGRWAILSYGNGVVTSLQARRALFKNGIVGSEDAVDIIDCPYLSAVPNGLRVVVGQYDGLLLADPCKAGPGSSVLDSMAVSLHNEGLLPDVWKVVAAPRTYNPLGSTITFLSVEDIEEAGKSIAKQLGRTECEPKESREISTASSFHSPRRKRKLNHNHLHTALSSPGSAVSYNSARAIHSGHPTDRSSSGDTPSAPPPATSSSPGDEILRKAGIATSVFSDYPQFQDFQAEYPSSSSYGDDYDDLGLENDHLDMSAMDGEFDDDFDSLDIDEYCFDDDCYDG